MDPAARREMGSAPSGTEEVRLNSSRPREELLPRFTSSAGSEIPRACLQAFTVVHNRKKEKGGGGGTEGGEGGGQIKSCCPASPAMLAPKSPSHACMLVKVSQTSSNA